MRESECPAVNSLKVPTSILAGSAGESCSRSPARAEIAKVEMARKRLNDWPSRSSKQGSSRKVIMIVVGDRRGWVS